MSRPGPVLPARPPAISAASRTSPCRVEPACRPCRSEVHRTRVIDRRWLWCTLGVLLFLGVIAMSGGDGGIARGNALNNENLIGGGGPAREGEPLTFGLVRTWNQSEEPVELVSARLLRLDPDLRLLGFSARPEGGVPVTAREHPVPDAAPLEDFPVQPPAEKDEEQFVVLFGLKIRPGGTEGLAVGVELTYRQGEKLRKQEFPAVAYVCDYEEVKKRIEPAN